MLVSVNHQNVLSGSKASILNVVYIVICQLSKLC